MFFPLKKHTRFKIFREVYGVSKISGSLKDLIKFGKYSVLPDWFNLDNELKHIIFTYKNNDTIHQVLENVINEYVNRFNIYSEKVKKHAEYYSFEKMKEIQENILYSLINKCQD